MTDPSPAKIVLPVGLDLGVNYHGDEPSTSRTIRVDAASRPFEPDQYHVWKLAHHAAGDDGTPRSRSQIVEEAQVAGIQNADQVMEGLLGMGMLFELAPGTDETMQFASIVRIMPRVAGVGVSHESYPLVMFGVAGSPVGAIPSGVFDVLTWGTLDRNLLQACERSALRARDRGEAQPDRTDPRTLLEHFLHYAPDMIAVGALTFDFIRTDDFASTDARQEADAV